MGMVKSGAASFDGRWIKTYFFFSRIVGERDRDRLLAQGIPLNTLNGFRGNEEL